MSAWNSATVLINADEWSTCVSVRGTNTAMESLVLLLTTLVNGGSVIQPRRKLLPPYVVKSKTHWKTTHVESQWDLCFWHVHTFCPLSRCLHTHTHTHTNLWLHRLILLYPSHIKRCPVPVSVLGIEGNEQTSSRLWCLTVLSLYVPV